MKLNARMHRQIRLQNLIFTVLLLASVSLAAWLSTRHAVQWDWTRDGRNTLSQASLKVLELLDGPVTLTVFAAEASPAGQRIGRLAERYRSRKPDVTVAFVNPDLAPDKARTLGITQDGEVAVEFGGRREVLQDVTEGTLTNALERVALAEDRWIAFLTGHGERDPRGDGKRDLGQFAGALARKGISAQRFSLTTVPEIPANTAALVLASPEKALLSGEIDLIGQFLDGGGNLLWLTEPDGKTDFSALEERLGLTRLPGVVVDASSRLYGVDNPTFALIAEYFPHAITRDFRTLTVFPAAAALEADKESPFSAMPFLTTGASAWTETSPIEGRIRFDAGGAERNGPLALGFALTRVLEGGTGTREQRIVVIGDGDFLSNTYLGNGGNLDLGLNIVRWLSHDERFLDIPAKTARDGSLALSPVAVSVIGFGFLLVLPAALIGSGLAIWWRRRSR